MCAKGIPTINKSQTMLYEVYPKYDINFKQGDGSYVIDDQGNRYLDCYGGHAVISIGHNHPSYVSALKDQLDQLGFYSNSVNMPLQEQLSKRVNELAGTPAWQMFMCNSGAEANENALKLASFYTGKSKILAFDKGFHGRMTASCAATDSTKIQTALNKGVEVVLEELNDIDAAIKEIATGTYSAVIVEPIQGIGGIRVATDAFLQALQAACDKVDTFLIMDEVQCGFGRSGDFWAYQRSGIEPDVVSAAKGMGNGFPVGAVWVNPKHSPKMGILGSTFGGNHLACRAALAVSNTIADEDLLSYGTGLGSWLKESLLKIDGVNKVTGRGMMIGIHLGFPIKELREMMLFEEKVFLGSSSNPNVIRFLPPLNITKADLQVALDALQRCMSKLLQKAE